MSARLALAAAVLLVPGIAAADVPERHTGPSFELSGGGICPSHMEPEDTGQHRVEFRCGPTVRGTIGWNLPDGWGVGLELGYASAGPSSFRLHDEAGDRDTGGKFTRYSALVVGSWTYGYQRDWAIWPRFRAGVGGSRLDAYLGTPMSLNGAEQQKTAENGRGTTNVRPMWMVEAGAVMPLNERFSLTAGCRYGAPIGSYKLPGREDVDDGFEFEGTECALGVQVGF